MNIFEHQEPLLRNRNKPVNKAKLGKVFLSLSAAALLILGVTIYNGNSKTDPIQDSIESSDLKIKDTSYINFEIDAIQSLQEVPTTAKCYTLDCLTDVPESMNNASKSMYLAFGNLNNIDFGTGPDKMGMFWEHNNVTSIIGKDNQVIKIMEGIGIVTRDLTLLFDILADETQDDLTLLNANTEAIDAYQQSILDNYEDIRYMQLDFISDINYKIEEEWGSPWQPGSSQTFKQYLQQKRFFDQTIRDIFYHYGHLIGIHTGRHLTKLATEDFVQGLLKEVGQFAEFTDSKREFNQAKQKLSPMILGGLMGEMVRADQQSTQGFQNQFTASDIFQIFTVARWQLFYIEYMAYLSKNMKSTTSMRGLIDSLNNDLIQYRLTADVALTIDTERCDGRHVEMLMWEDKEIQDCKDLYPEHTKANPICCDYFKCDPDTQKLNSETLECFTSCQPDSQIFTDLEGVEGCRLLCPEGQSYLTAHDTECKEVCNQHTQVLEGSVCRNLTTQAQNIHTGDYGDWTSVKTCDTGSLVCGAQIQFVDDRGYWDDDQAAVGLKLKCCSKSNWYNQQTKEIFGASYEQEGKRWLGDAWCDQDKFVVAIGFRNEPPMGYDRDDTALNAFILRCQYIDGSGQQEIYVNEGMYGDWSTWFTFPPNMFMNGAQVRHEEHMSNRDDTGLNGINVQVEEAYEQISYYQE